MTDPINGVASGARRIGILAALPSELRSLVKGWKKDAVEGRSHSWQQKSGDCEWIAVCSGMGKDAVARAFAHAEKNGKLSAVMSVGLAGALTHDVVSGAVYQVGKVVDAQTGERYLTAAQKENAVTLVSVSAVARKQEKHRLARAYNAQLVDMEAATVGRLASARGIPFFCCKAVSDTLHEQLPDFAKFTGRDGDLKVGRLLAHVAIRPQYWIPLARIGNATRKGAASLALELEGFLRP